MTEGSNESQPERARREEFELTGGDGILEMQGDDFDTALLFDGKPMSMNWCDCQGSVGQYLLNCQTQVEAKERLATIRAVLEDSLCEEASLVEQLDPLLKLFRDGHYACRYFTPEDWALESAGDRILEVYLYPETFLLATRTTSSLDKSTIKRYQDSIRPGNRPVAIVATTGDSFVQHVVDGHHKLHAYQTLDILPSLIELESLKPRRIAKSEAIKWIGRFSAARVHYQRHKPQ